MKPKYLERVPELDGMIEKARVVTIVTHTHPDGDAIGSGLAMKHYLRKCRGKDACLVVPDPVPDTLAFLIADEPEGEILTHSRTPLQASRQVADSDLILCQDFNAFSRTAGLETALRISPAPKILIDHHLNPDFDAFRLAFSTPDISSTSEYVYWILKEMPDIGGEASRLPAAARKHLLAGMTTDTNNFANSVFPSTLKMASELLDAGEDRDTLLAELYNNYRENRIRVMGYLLYEKLKITPEGAAYMILTKEDQDRFDSGRRIRGFVNMPLRSTGCLSLFLKEEDGHFGVASLEERCLRQRLRHGLFHGGGHELAAGGKLYFPEDVPRLERRGIHLESYQTIFQVMKTSRKILFACMAALAAASCNKELDATYEQQEGTIASIVQSFLKADSTHTVSHQDGSTRVTVVQGSGENCRKEVPFPFYAGHYLSGTSLSASNLFATNSMSTLGRRWNLSDTTAFTVATVKLSSPNW